MSTLGALLDDAGVHATLDSAASSLEISTVELDSRRCTDGSLFVCMPGHATSGATYVADALARGAVCVVSAERDVAAPVHVEVPAATLRSTLASLSSAIVGHPARELTLAGVTGTNGKTTVSWLVAGICAGAGFTAASIGTLNGQHTTPDAPELHRRLREVADRAHAADRRGVVALEVSSHALDQGRVDGITFQAAAFTNLSRDHLDYHGTMDAYFEAKATLFDPARAAAAVVCVDDEWGERLAASCPVPVTEVRSSDATEVALAFGSTSFTWHGRRVVTRLTGAFNVPNALIALEVAHAMGVAMDVAVDQLAGVEPVPGRAELVGDGHPAVVVDFAHTPAALEGALRDLRRIRPTSRLAVVFGCGGDRDAGKRPLMGEVASRLADEVVVTSDNPRSEDPAAIIAAVVAGATGSAPVRTEVDRRAAIFDAIAAAGADDVVLIAGKGHERTQEVAGEVVAFDDAVVAGEALASRAARC